MHTYECICGASVFALNSLATVGIGCTGMRKAHANVWRVHASMCARVHACVRTCARACVRGRTPANMQYMRAMRTSASQHLNTQHLSTSALRTSAS